MNDDPEGRQLPDPSAAGGPAPPPPSGTPESRPDRPAGAPLTSPDARIQGGSLRLFRAAGIDVLLHWSWFFFAFLRLQPSGSDDSLGLAHYGSPLWYAVEYLALGAIVLLHEFGHVLACRSVGGIANRIVLWPLGGIAFVDPPARPGAWLWSVAAGPLVNALLLAPTLGFWAACHAAGCQDTAPDVYRFAAGLAWINGYMLLFNLLPVYPLDGGRMLQALLWFVMGRARSLLVAAVIGLLTGLGLLIVAIVERSLVWGVMAGLGLLVCLVGLQGARALGRVLRAPPRKEAACPACGAAPPTGSFWACQRCWSSFDVFAAGGTCRNCSTPLEAVLCPGCGRSRPYREWHPGAVPPGPLDRERRPVPAGADGARRSQGMPRARQPWPSAWCGA
jgi:Zn-dependent protease